MEAGWIAHVGLDFLGLSKPLIPDTQVPGTTQACAMVPNNLTSWLHYASVRLSSIYHQKGCCLVIMFKWPVFSLILHLYLFNLLLVSVSYIIDLHIYPFQHLRLFIKTFFIIIICLVCWGLCVDLQTVLALNFRCLLQASEWCGCSWMPLYPM